MKGTAYHKAMGHHETGNAAPVSKDALSFRGVDPGETVYPLKFMNKIVGVDDEESRWYWIQRLMSLQVIDGII